MGPQLKMGPSPWSLAPLPTTPNSSRTPFLDWLRRRIFFFFFLKRMPPAAFESATRVVADAGPVLTYYIVGSFAELSTASFTAASVGLLGSIMEVILFMCNGI